MSGNDIALINMAGKAKVHMMSGEIGEAAWFIDQITIEAATTITALQAEVAKANEWAREQHAAADRYVADVAALREALRCSPIPALREEMMAFRDRQDKWLRDTYAPVMARAALGQQP